MSPTNIEMGWSNIRYVRWVEVLRLHNRLLNMKTDRWPRKVYEFHKKLGKKCWLSDVRHVTDSLHLPSPDNNVLYDLDSVQAAALCLSMDNWWKDAHEKSKLRTYLQVSHKKTKAL